MHSLQSQFCYLTARELANVSPQKTSASYPASNTTPPQCVFQSRAYLQSDQRTSSSNTTRFNLQTIVSSGGQLTSYSPWWLEYKAVRLDASAKPNPLHNIDAHSSEPPTYHLPRLCNILHFPLSSLPSTSTTFTITLRFFQVPSTLSTQLQVFLHHTHPGSGLTGVSVPEVTPHS